MMKKLRAGLIGIGMMGKNHSRILTSLEGVDLVGVADPLNLEDNFLKSLKINTYKSYSSLIEQGIDYCVISAPTGFHKEIAIELLNSGVHCLIEKPVASNLEEALDIKKAAEKNDLIVGIGHIERYNSAIKQLRTRLKNGDLGEIYQISTKRQGPFPSRIADVGVIRDLATHDIDLTMWLTGSEYKSVFAQTTNRTKNQHEDLVSVTGVLKNNIIVNMLVNWLSPIKEREIVVLGEKGSFRVDTLSSDLIFYENGTKNISQEAISHFKGSSDGSTTKFSFEKFEPLLVEHQNFRDKLLGNSSEIVSIDDGIKVIKVSDAIIESGITGECIKF
jgi:predicted dehydrogenase